MSVLPWFTSWERRFSLLRARCVDIKFFLPNVVDVKKRCRAFLERSDGLFGISRRSSQCGVREEPTERRQSAGQARAFLQLRHFEGQSATGRLPLRHEAVILLREIKIPIMTACQSLRRLSVVNSRDSSEMSLINNTMSAVRKECNKRHAKTRQRLIRWLRDSMSRDRSITKWTLRQSTLFKVVCNGWRISACTITYPRNVYAELHI